ncbi:MAG: hypothetical protein NTW76_14265 [Corynebacteriales bacterium]|nr:hypothetical protein [Mycobacteriales bacterium]
MSTTVAADQGYRALNDVATIAQGINYRVIGGHMVQLLLHAYPTAKAQVRLTADADAGVERQVAASGDLHLSLVAAGYTAVQGNSYQRRVGDEKLSVDLLTEAGADNSPVELGGRMFDAAPGLHLALAGEPLRLDVSVSLLSGGSLDFGVHVPDVSEALVLKALAWDVRMAKRDVSDVNTLLEIVAAHGSSLPAPWPLTDGRVRHGARKDAARALHRIAALNDRGNLHGVSNPARTAALIRRHVLNPDQPAAPE